MHRSKEEIISIMEEQYGYIISDRTFDRMLYDVRELGYEVVVENRSNKYRYWIRTDYLDIDYEIIIQLNSLLSRKELLKKLGPKAESNFIIQNYIDKGVHNVTAIIEALNQRRDLCFDYTNRESHKTSSRLVLPFKLMEAEYRWYLISWDYEHNNLLVFSLDKMKNIILGNKFSWKNVPKEVWNKVNSYENRIGVNKPLFEEEPFRVFNIKIGVTPEYKQFVKRLPIHNSQKFINESFNEFQFLTIDVIPDYTLLKKISSELGSLKLMGPPELKERVLQEYPWFSAFMM